MLDGEDVRRLLCSCMCVCDEIVVCSPFATVASRQTCSRLPWRSIEKRRELYVEDKNKNLARICSMSSRKDSCAIMRLALSAANSFESGGGGRFLPSIHIVCSLAHPSHPDISYSSTLSAYLDCLVSPPPWLPPLLNCRRSFSITHSRSSHPPLYNTRPSPSLAPYPMHTSLLPFCGGSSV